MILVHSVTSNTLTMYRNEKINVQKWKNKCWQGRSIVVFCQSCFRELSKNSQEARIPGKLEIIKKSKNFKKVVDNSENRWYYIRVASEKDIKRQKTGTNTFKEIWKKVKKFLTSRKQHDRISKLSVRQQDKKWTLITEQWNTFLESSFKIIKRTIERSLKTVKGIN